ncbi:tRNA (guanosine(37)-N1)-methyltransferase TrmD [Candidatus Microgenomates bacterium]|nr:MAG: tRNA (guanosine(37)-N1)-methyltransferase TrmD [Candidatus Microgenomates bacterium]
MKIDIITLFPDMFTGPFDTSMLKKAQDCGAVEINIHNLRKWSVDKHKTVDDRPFGGGPGMVLMIEPIDRALKTLKRKSTRVILLSPQGETFSQKRAVELSSLPHIIFVAGHYEGFDERIRENLVDEELSIGKYVLTGGEIPAMAVVDTIVRLLPGVLEEEAKTLESFSEGNLLDYPVYTRPSIYKKWKVPEVFLGGDHKKINEWRTKMALDKTSKA